VHHVPERRFMKRAIKTLIHPVRVALSKLVMIPPPPSFWPSLTLLEKIAYFVASDKVDGDYVEFGVFRGNTLIEAYQAMSKVFAERIRAAGPQTTGEDARERQEIWNRMRFFAFDSFEGLPELQGIDKDTRDFAKGQYAASVDEVRQNLLQKGVPLDRFVFVPGWFDQTCTPATIEKHQIRKAAVIWVDCDLYHSTKSVLDFITPLVQDGTVIVFDDWYAYRGNPRRGEQQAFSEWVETLSGYTLAEYQKEGPWRLAYLVSSFT
jgi:hypothetical protein